MSDLDGGPDSPARIEALLRDLGRLEGVACPRCLAAICGHEAVMSVALGYKNAPRCAGCLAAELEREAGELTSQMFEYVDRRPCFRAGWTWASRREGVEDGGIPACLRRRNGE